MVLLLLLLFCRVTISGRRQFGRNADGILALQCITFEVLGPLFACTGTTTLQSSCVRLLLREAL